jgi:hypothetical protein
MVFVPCFHGNCIQLHYKVATELVVENMLQLLSCRPLPGKVRKQCLFCLSVLRCLNEGVLHIYNNLCVCVFMKININQTVMNRTTVFTYWGKVPPDYYYSRTPIRDLPGEHLQFWGVPSPLCVMTNHTTGTILDTTPTTVHTNSAANPHQIISRLHAQQK